MKRAANTLSLTERSSSLYIQRWETQALWYAVIPESDILKSVTLIKILTFAFVIIGTIAAMLIGLYTAGRLLKLPGNFQVIP